MCLALPARIIEIDEDGNVTVFDGETEIGTFEWPAKKWFYKGKRSGDFQISCCFE